MKVHNITHDNFQEEVLASQQPVLLDFWAPWCGPCNLLSPVLEELAAERPDLKVCKVNVDAERELASQYKVYRIPTLLVMSQGLEEDRIIGARSKQELLEFFE